MCTAFARANNGLFRANSGLLEGTAAFLASVLCDVRRVVFAMILDSKNATTNY